METLQALEKKIEALVGYIKALKNENAQIKEESLLLHEKITQLESSLLKETIHSEKFLEQEKALTSVVDELIKDIDDLLQKEN